MTAARPESWAVLGGGLLGQALALRLREAGREVTLIEAAPELGGLAATWTVGGLTYDKFYHVILPFDSRTLALVESLGLSDRLVWKKTSTGFFCDGRLVPLNGSADYLRLPVIGLVDKLRLAALLMAGARIEDGAPLDRVPVGEWLVRWCGQRCYDRLWEPLLRAKLGENHRKASAAFIWASIRRLYLARKGTGKVEELGFVQGGYGTVLDALAGRLAEAGVEVQTGTQVRKVVRADDGLLVQTAAGVRRFDRVVSTLPARVTARICDGLAPDERARLDEVVYQGIVCASLVLSRPLAGHYLTYLTDKSLPFTGIVEMSALTGTEGFGGRTLVYLPRYMTQDDAFWALDDAGIEARFLDGLRRVYPDLRDDEILEVRCARVRDVMAVPTVGYRDRVPAVETSVPGLHVVTSAQILDGTLNVDATLGAMEAALPVLLAAGDPAERRLVA
jgi:protoporphyrinogen oxidase